MKYQRLTPDERETIGIMLSQNKSLPDIARALERSTSAISREIARNTSDGMPYRAFQAQERAEHEARQRRKGSKIVDSKALQDFIKEKLRLRWSPKQIEEELKKTYPDDRSMQASHETIYTYLYVQTKGTLKKELISYLRQAKKSRQSRSKSEEKRGKITNMISIHDRPSEEDACRFLRPAQSLVTRNQREHEYARAWFLSERIRLHKNNRQGLVVCAACVKRTTTRNVGLGNIQRRVH